MQIQNRMNIIAFIFLLAGGVMGTPWRQYLFNETIQNQTLTRFQPLVLSCSQALVASPSFDCFITVAILYPAKRGTSEQIVDTRVGLRVDDPTLPISSSPAPSHGWPAAILNNVQYMFNGGGTLGVFELATGNSYIGTMPDSTSRSFAVLGSRIWSVFFNFDPKTGDSTFPNSTQHLDLFASTCPKGTSYSLDAVPTTIAAIPETNLVVLYAPKPDIDLRPQCPLYAFYDTTMSLKGQYTLKVERLNPVVAVFQKYLVIFGGNLRGGGDRYPPLSTVEIVDSTTFQSTVTSMSLTSPDGSAGVMGPYIFYFGGTVSLNVPTNKIQALDTRTWNMTMLTNEVMARASIFPLVSYSVSSNALLVAGGSIIYASTSQINTYRCGNGVLDVGEECDAGSNCPPTCRCTYGTRPDGALGCEECPECIVPTPSPPPPQGSNDSPPNQPLSAPVDGVGSSETNFWLCVAAAILSFILLITGIIMMSKSKKMKKRKKNCCKGWGVALFVIGLLGLATSVSLAIASNPNSGTGSTTGGGPQPPSSTTTGGSPPPGTGGCAVSKITCRECNEPVPQMACLYCRAACVYRNNCYRADCIKQKNSALSLGDSCPEVVC